MEFALLIHGPERAWAELSGRDRATLFAAYLDLPSEEAALEWAGRLPAGPGDRVGLRRCDRGRMSR
ncbi:hypothetical protein ABT158_23990 [Nonomuraea sp. NPDC001636]|uniref:hypothetical protein n=1 Tax=Nonomuraea sp. NPDC001636 TaxID=3154391 RepID=UPI0033258506